MTTERRFPDRVIDAHTHVFNAHYLPVSSIVARYAGSWLGNTLERIIYAVTAAPDLERELPLAGGAKLLVPQDEERAIEQFAEHVEARSRTSVRSSGACCAARRTSVGSSGAGTGQNRT